MSQGNAYMKRT